MRTRMFIVLGIVLGLPLLAGSRTYMVTAANVRGEPTLEANQTSGYYLWCDRQGLHLRWTTDGTPLLFTGRIDLDKPVREVKRVRQEAGGWARSHGKRVVMFSATSRGDIDGVDVVVPAARRARIELQIDGKDASAEQIFLGARGLHPDGVPLKVALP